MKLQSDFLAKTTNTPFNIEVEKAEGVYIFDKQGKKYFDLISGIAVSNLGHNNLAINAAIKEQVDKYLHVMVFGEYSQTPQIELANKLNELLPDNLTTSYFVNSGTEANEAALKLAKRYTGRTEIIAFYKSYHGSTHGSLSVSGNETKKNAFRPLLPDVRFIHFDNLLDLQNITKKTACVIVEPIQGDAGVRIPTKVFMEALRSKCDETGTLLIFDEIQTGFGRTGKFFAFEHFNVVPDILTIAKAMGGGMPIGAFIASKEIMDILTRNPELGHITTFGGHPVNCVAALANINELLKDNLIASVEKKGQLFEEIITHPSIKQIRRKGLFFAIEMYSPETVQKVVEGCKNRGVLSFWFLSCPESFRIAPPLTISENEIRISAKIIWEVINELG